MEREGSELAEVLHESSPSQEAAPPPLKKLKGLGAILTRVAESAGGQEELPLSPSDRIKGRYSYFGMFQQLTLILIPYCGGPENRNDCQSLQNCQGNSYVYVEQVCLPSVCLASLDTSLMTIEVDWHLGMSIC